MDRICPLLAMAGDRRTVCDGYDPNHRCWSSSPPPALDRAQQTDVCLTAAHGSCPHLVGSLPPAEPSLPVDQRLSSSRLIVVPDGAWHGLASRSAGATSGPRLLGAAVVLVAGGALATVTGGLSALEAFAVDLQRASVVTAADGAVPSATIAPTPAPTETPTTRPQPVAVPSVALTPAPTATPVVASASPTATAPPATPAAARRYVVQPGDTLSTIANRFGVSVQALQQANGIADQNVIAVGQTLIIPAAS